MRIIGFLVFILGLIMSSIWIAILGFVIYEAPGITWLGVLWGTSDSNDDHGP